MSESEIPNFRVNGYLSSTRDVLRKPTSSLAEFAWHYANEASETHGQASMRSENTRGYPVPRRLELNPHYQKRVDDARSELAKLQEITPRNPRDMSRLNAAVGEWYAAYKAGYANVIANRELEVARGQRMIDAIDSWVAPAALLDLKLAMRKALVLTGEQWPPMTEPSMPPDLLEWHEKRLGRAHGLLANAIKALADEKKTIDALNEWLDAMHASFGEPVPYETAPPI